MPRGGVCVAVPPERPFWCGERAVWRCGSQAPPAPCTPLARPHRARRPPLSHTGITPTSEWLDAWCVSSPPPPPPPCVRAVVVVFFWSAKAPRELLGAASPRPFSPSLGRHLQGDEKVVEGLASTLMMMQPKPGAPSEWSHASFAVVEEEDGTR
jgi:hypothetical protein